MEHRQRSEDLYADYDEGLFSRQARLASSVRTRILWGLADHAARNQVPVELQDLPHLDMDSPSPAQAAVQRLRSLIYAQASYRILAAVFEGVAQRI